MYGHYKSQPAIWSEVEQGAETSLCFCAILYRKPNIPRQGRDKHKKS